MKRLLDTNICIYVLRGNAQVMGSLRAHSPASLRLSAVTLAELWFGARKSRSPERMRALQDAFTAPFEVLPFDNAAAEHYAVIRQQLESRGLPIGERDQMIAATAMAHGCAVVTHNRREFDRVEGLTVEDWLQAA